MTGILILENIAISPKAYLGGLWGSMVVHVASFE